MPRAAHMLFLDSGRMHGFAGAMRRRVTDSRYLLILSQCITRYLKPQGLLE